MIFLLQDGLSPLMIAISKGHLDVVKTLIEAGANVNQTNKVGICTCTLILWAVAMAASHPTDVAIMCMVKVFKSAFSHNTSPQGV